MSNKPFHSHNEREKDRDRDNHSQTRTVYSAPTGAIFLNHLAAGATEPVTSRTQSAQRQRPRSASSSARRDNRLFIQPASHVNVGNGIKNELDLYGQISRYLILCTKSFRIKTFTPSCNL